MYKIVQNSIVFRLELSLHCSMPPGPSNLLRVYSRKGGRYSKFRINCTKLHKNCTKLWLHFQIQNLKTVGLNASTSAPKFDSRVLQHNIWG